MWKQGSSKLMLNYHFQIELAVWGVETIFRQTQTVLVDCISHYIASLNPIKCLLLMFTSHCITMKSPWNPTKFLLLMVILSLLLVSYIPFVNGDTIINIPWNPRHPHSSAPSRTSPCQCWRPPCRCWPSSGGRNCCCRNDACRPWLAMA